MNNNKQGLSVKKWIIKILAQLYGWVTITYSLANQLTNIRKKWLRVRIKCTLKYTELNKQLKYTELNKQLKHTELNKQLKYTELNKQLKYTELNKQLKYTELNKQLKYTEPNKQLKYTELNKQLIAKVPKSRLFMRHFKKFLTINAIWKMFMKYFSETTRNFIFA
jgi:hypothetical protein